MGQLQDVETAPAEVPDAQYASYSTAELQRLLSERGLASPRKAAGSTLEQRSLLLSMLRAFDAGLQAARGGGTANVQERSQLSPIDMGLVGRGGFHQPAEEDVVVQQMLESPGLKGLDIGGTLAKMVLALPREDALSQKRFPEEFGATGRTRRDLELNFELGSKSYFLSFASGATSHLVGAIASIQRRASWQADCSPSDSGDELLPRQWLAALAGPGPAESSDDAFVSGSCSSLRHARGMGSNVSTASTRDSLCEEALEDGEAKSPRLPPPVRHRIFTAGGGAHKYAPLFRQDLQTELVPVKELQAVVDGLLFLATHGLQSSRPDGLLYEVSEAGIDSPLSWPDQLFPFVVVSVGSGVSILRVNSAAEGDYDRVGGTACGGGTFLGLARALTSASSFEEALALAEGGDASKCDLLVRDIYGDEGSVSLGLPGKLTAANCGRLCEDFDGVAEQDIARALLQMVTQQCVLLSAAHARHSGCVDRVFFAGGFVEEGNHLARSAIAANFRSLGGRAYFLRHCDFLGALGSLRSCMKEAGEDV